MFHLSHAPDHDLGSHLLIDTATALDPEQPFVVIEGHSPIGPGWHDASVPLTADASYGFVKERSRGPDSGDGRRLS
jgi:hypothetical protein